MANTASFLTIFFIVFLLWLPQAVYQVITWTYWLQIKEYRFDRFWVFLRSKEGRDSLGFLIIGAKLLVLITAGSNFFLLIITFIISDLLLIENIVKKKIRIPEPTKRVKNIFLTSFLGITLTFVSLYFLFFSAFLLGEILIILLPFLGIIWTVPLVNKAKNEEVRKARMIFKKFNPTVIGITGSYGKTTTKEFIFQLLSTKYKCLSTYKNQNTHFGILRRINSHLIREHEFFIAEMGAYKMGEIKEIAGILKPKSAVLTGIEEQHLELFGSFEKLKKAKFEIIESLVSGGDVFFNSTDRNISDLIKKTKKLKKGIKVFTYCVGRKKEFDAVSEITKVTQSGIVFKMLLDGDEKEIKTNLLAKKLIENLTGAILVARKYGVDWEKIIKKCNNLLLPEGTLNIYKTNSGITVVDDSYNSSPSGFEAALDVLGTLKGKRTYVVTTGIIELGKVTKRVHEKIGMVLEGTADIVLLRNKDFEIPLRKGMKDKDKLICMTNPKRIIGYLRENLVKGDIILVEGKVPQVTDYLKSL
jgi:UDP-N-acetylmuramoyl-tripeptide--D-alanyl-D-alanine ligase